MRFLVKKLLIILSLISVSTTHPYSFPAWALFGKAKKQEQPVAPAPIAPIIPKVITIEAIDPINFKELKSNLIKAIRSNEIKGVILTVNSMGGNNTDFAVIHDLIKRGSEQKPIIAVVEANALSNGYLIASAARYIFASSGALIGSIGTIFVVKRYKNAKIKGEIEADIEATVFAAGEFKSINSPYSSSLTERQKEFIDSIIGKMYQNFIDTVAQNRNIKAAEYKDWAEAKEFIVSEAKELGLIDSIGTIFEAEDKILEMIKERNPNTVYGTSVEQVVFPSAPVK